MAIAQVLIIDDEPFNVDYLEQELEEVGYETISAANGQEALAKIESETPDLVLLDIMMPVMDGFQVLSHLRANANTRDLPVIVISASNDLKSVVRGIELGAEDYLPKPFEPKLLHARISSSLEKKRLRDLQKLYLKGLERELQIASEIQQSFLPCELPRVDNWEMAVYFKAAREVAGDYYDAFTLPDGNLICVVGDVCGKGVGAALFMTLFRTLIRATYTTNVLWNESGNMISSAERLKRVISFANRYVAETHADANMFSTAFIGAFDVQDGTLTYANCGNESPVLLRQGCIEKVLEPTGPVVGVLAEASFRTNEIALEKDDLLVAFTDGVPDSSNSDDENYGTERLLALLNGGTGSANAVIEKVIADVREFVGNAAQFDDITIMAIKRNA